MLEVKNLKKEYKSKKGVVTKALDGVSLTFPETGMIFILGKSGSGKSTLLNVCGGLDKADSGEIVIKGKSSKEFSGSDFDSYRNTYVGFVFQEYNILDEFTVEENIALALELQSKKRDKAVIEKILTDVDMTDFASRKPNTLSGGQKQRVAIARALVKEPEIIMADEPTGALDSKTGQQVFDTLKHLSKSKLVLVISHDRDFAEQYGDRIIELKDGKVISDQTREEFDKDNRNVRFYGTDVVCVNDGAKLTDGDLLSIKQFLSKAGGAAVISTSREQISRVKEERPEIEVGAFKDIEAQPVSKEYPKQNLIRSRLPLRHAVKMGASSLKSKPIRLVFTILLSVIAFVLFGLASTLMLFNGDKVRVKTFTDSTINYISLSKIYYETYHYDDDSYDSERNTTFTDAELKEFQKKYAGAIGLIGTYSTIENVNMPNNVLDFYGRNISAIVEANSALELVTGKLPAKDNEIAITDFMFESFCASGVRMAYGNQTNIIISNYNDILYTESKPVTLKIANSDYRVVGIFKGSEVQLDYKALKEAADQNEESSSFSSYMWRSERDSGLYMCIAVSPEKYAEIKEESYADGNTSYFNPFEYSQNNLNLKVDELEFVWYLSSMAKYVDPKLQIYDGHGNEVNSLSNGEFAINYRQLAEIYSNVYYETERKYQNDPEYEQRLQDRYEAALIEFEEENPIPDFEDYEDENEYWNSLYGYDNAKIKYADGERDKLRWNYAYMSLREERERQAEEEYRAANPEPADKTGEEYMNWNRGLNDAIWRADPIYIFYNYYSDYSKNEIMDMMTTVCGLFEDMNLSPEFTAENAVISDGQMTLAGWFIYSGYGGCYLGDDLYEEFFISYGGGYQPPTTNYEVPSDAYLSKILLPYDGSEEMIKELLKLHSVREDDDSAIFISNAILTELDMIIELADSLEKGFIIAGAVLAVFAFLLMFNFISASITAKKKEIGILRAIGARTMDVFKIFMAEALIIALICLIISVFGTLGLCILLNSIILTDVGLSISLFVFGPLSVLCMLAIAVVTATVSTVLPVSLYSRKPPVDSIRAL